MCGRYASTLPPELMMELFHLLRSVDLIPRYNIAPTQPICAIWEESGRREAHFARWGLVPRWVKDPREWPLLINARVETMAEKPAFRDLLKHGRCVVPASGYYEWRTNLDKSKQPFYITTADGGPMALAGLYAIWSGPEGEEVDTVATITVPANDQLAPIHDRMPAILQCEAIAQWLDVRGVDARTARQLAIPLDNGALKFHPVSTRINSAKYDDEGLIEPMSDVKPHPTAPNKAASAQMDLF
ncbi:SOS response-associated peptidase [uncultured Devosia sp.]|uniref:SOS response-associated peptidase n=1 Tax=uncultured Devosia sp. TaxID=211434 RepID=UPI0035CB7831